MNIFGSFMDIFGSLMDIFDQKKNKDIYVERKNKGIYVENESFLHFLFVLRSPCTNFASQFAILEYTPIYIIIVYESDSRHR